MKRFLVVTVCLLSLGLASTTFAADKAKAKPENATARIGTFDSRLVATAYVRSEAFQLRVQEMQEELEKAKAAGNDQRVKQLQREGAALQDVVHKQGFSTWPIDDILKTIKEKIPGIAQQADVDLIVSKWNLVYQKQNVQPVDVTELMVAPFNPDEETRKVLAQLSKQDPVALDKLKKHP